MRYRKLGRTEIEVSVVCCGAMAMGSSGTFGEQEDELSVRTVHAAMEMGVNFFDTAEGYGAGHSEEVLGRALEGRRDRAVVATKVSSGHLRDEDLIEACEKSLRRLRTDHVDLYQVHWPNRHIPFADTAAVLERLREHGKIRCWGVSNFGRLDLADALEGPGHPQVDQLPYSLLWRVIEHEIVPRCLDNDVGVICYSPLAQGILTGKFGAREEIPGQRQRARYCKDEVIDRTFAVVKELGAVSDQIGRSTAEVALAWLLHRPGVTAVIAGMRTPHQGCQNAEAADLDLEPELVERLERASRPLLDALDTNPDMWQEGEESRYR